MQPLLLQQEIERLFEHTPLASIRQARKLLSQDYQMGRSSPFGDESKRLAYLGARMGATYAAVHKVLQKTSLKGSLLDLGAGPGSASWAALELFPNLEKITLIEKNSDAITLGKALAQNHPVLKKALWIQQDLHKPIPTADTAVFSYVLSEIHTPETIVASSWNAVSQLVIIEPGTPKGFDLILKIREQLIDLGAFILAPCPHAFSCPMQKKDWCHFSTRVERTKIHRFLKEGSLGYEDEKFCYLIASKTAQGCKDPRILKRPLKGPGQIRFSLCTNEGKLEEKTIFQKEKESYRQARKTEWGDILMS